MKLRWWVLVTTLFTLLLVSSSAWADRKTAESCAQASEEGQLFRVKGKLKAARDAFVSCAKAVCPPVVRRDCNTWVGEIDDIVPTVTVAARDGAGNDLVDAKLTIDGSLISDRLDGKAVALDPGPHTIVVTSNAKGGGASVEKTVVLREGEKRRAVDVSFASPAPPPPSNKPSPPQQPQKQEEKGSGRTIAGWGLVGLGTVGVGIGTYFAIVQQGHYDDGLVCTPNPPCGDEFKDDVDRERVIAGIAFGVGGAALVGGIVLLLLGGDSTKTTAGMDWRRPMRITF